MKLVAYLHGRRVDATVIGRAEWRALVMNTGYPDLVLPECGRRAKRVTSHKGTQFFAHHPDSTCDVEHRPESEQHLMMKRAVADRINTSAGWRAEVEHAANGRDWIADVMAFSKDGLKVAFEVQLSQQTEEDYFYRSQRYFAANILPVWLVPRFIQFQELKVPMFETGFRKSTPLPASPDELMQHETWPDTDGVHDVGSAIDFVLSRRFVWADGSPEQQAVQRALALQRAQKAQLLADNAAQERNQRQAKEAADKNRQFDNDAMKFALGAVAARDVFGGAEPVAGATGISVWGSVIKCSKNGHRVLVWHAQKDGEFDVAANYQPSRPESGPAVRQGLDEWLATVGEVVPQANLTFLKNPPFNRRAFTCPACREIISQRFLARLTQDKWSLIAVVQERAFGSRVGRTKVGGYGQGAAQLSSSVVASKPLSGEEKRHRYEAIEKRREEKERIRSNPRYRDHGNDYRFTCLDCGREFEDYTEGIHADARCIASGVKRALGGS